MENKYQKLMKDIRVPEELNDRVLCAARRQARDSAGEQTGPKRLTRSRRFRPLVRTAVCAACALALVLGTVRFDPVDTQPDGPVGQENAPAVLSPSFSFGLTAYAAGTGESIRPNANGGLAFTMGDGLYWSAQEGYYTGCLFQVTGEHIRQVSLSLDRGGLYRSQQLENLTAEEMQVIREAQERGEIAPTSIDRDGDGNWSTEKMTKLGASVTEDYAPEVYYGIWTGGVSEAAWAEDPKAAEESSTDQLDGAVLTVTVTFDDGTEQTKAYHLSTGRLRVTCENDSGLTVLPQLAGDNEPYVYGIYAASETESRWFQWPVQGSRTVSRSNPFGRREIAVDNEPDPEEPIDREQLEAQLEKMRFHSGIDIPAPEGEVILAAADGTVTETGFDASHGNYLVIDHGDGLQTLYAHCRNVDVQEGDPVKAGEMLGAVGKTGMATGPHLHFEVRQDGEIQNPVAYFDKDIRDILEMK
ncbi:M23 family metallopeptidase [uncultured Dysosmobacter sp.]|uniref:M23 family metallopeptidase n=1 Tax=uncultured Dysosmobacter sp. TaxID=2591384 RepID=UPI00262BE376|nr:M23 family metallopeptidase [uncultured Dysosmobacter sp.]